MSTWVAENIDGSINGGSALETFKREWCLWITINAAGCSLPCRRHTCKVSGDAYIPRYAACDDFNGKVTGNTINGEFEVGHDRYRGDHALSFGVSPVFTEDVSIYLEAEEMIESDDPELVDLSLKITEGSADYWEAACRLSAWVDENIDGSVYGGSAYETFERGNGACGSQSMLLAALCRAAGIPARVVWGCMYTPAYDGSFGHHGWNEVYMGESGWIPIDVTIHETDYIDSGHIRLGILETAVTVINFREMTILD